jgi:glycosyltransferase involved in cell wall biosynthesis
MFPQQQNKALFAAFDIYPSAKGASTHIFHNASALFELMQGGWLSVLANPKLLDYEYEDKVEITRFAENIPNFLDRTQAYGAWLYEKLHAQPDLKLAHFRDCWSGIPILTHQQKNNSKLVTVYEVNGLPSIELPYRYPNISTQTLAKIQKLEDFCASKAQYIITPSKVIKQHLAQKGIAENKIQVISNGADIFQEVEQPQAMPSSYIIYFGALQPWQGLDILLKSMVYLRDFEDLKLVICSSTKERTTRLHQRLAEKLQVQDKIIWQYQLPKKQLYEWVHHAKLSVAPLKECARNLEQGCCPLKILESMALATPVIASDMPAVREIISHDSLGKLVRADRPTEWARAIRLMLEHPDYAEKMGQNAQKHIQEHYTWEQKRKELQAFYQSIL